MAVKKFSEIATSGSSPALTDTLIGVATATTDTQWTLSQIKATIAPTFTGFGNPANPGVNLTGSNGVATTALRSDAVFVLDVSISPTWAGQHIWSRNGAASAPPGSYTGAWFTTGDATTTKPQLLVEPSGTTSTGWSTAGTGIGVNAASGFAGRLLDLQLAGTSVFRVTAGGSTTVSGTLDVVNNAIQRIGTLQLGSSNDVILSRSAAATLQFGAANAASPVAQVVQGQGSRAGTDSNVGGASVTLRSGTGTGAGTISSLVLQSPVAVASGSGAQTQTTGLTIKAGAAVLTNYTVGTLPTAATAGAGAKAFVTDASATTFASIVAGSGANGVPVYSDGTNWRIG